MGDAAVLDMKGKPVTPKRKKERERICCMEEKPQADWFVQCKGSDGKTWWFLRLSVTGLKTRRFGPFATRHRALLFLDKALSGDTGEGLAGCVCEAGNIMDDYAVPNGRFENRGGHYPIIESELIRHAQGKGGEPMEEPEDRSVLR